MFPIASNTDDPGITYVDDVFSTYLYTGNNSLQTITNGIDLAGKGGLVWVKGRSGTYGAYNHSLHDTQRGLVYRLSTNNTNAQSNEPSDINSFNSNGFTLGGGALTNDPSTTYASWTFRKAAKFFDVVTWTGTSGVQTVSHNLGAVPAMLIMKATSAAGSWVVNHRSLPTGYSLLLDSSLSASSGSSALENATTTTFQATSYVNQSGQTYVAYLFAHDTSADGIIQCGSYVGTGSTTTINLGWEPQYVMIKKAIDPALNGVSPWIVMDNMRGLGKPYDNAFCPNTSTSEAGDVSVSGALQLTATGFQLLNANGALNVNTDTYIYMAIRRPNKPPASGAQVYNAIARTGTLAVANVAGVGFAPDLAWIMGRTPAWQAVKAFDRLRGANNSLYSNTTSAEVAVPVGDSLSSFNMDGVSLGSDSNNYDVNRNATYINHFFKRAPGFFDVVCYTGTGSANIQAHNLTVVPELMIVKARSVAAEPWLVWGSPLGITEGLYLHGSNAKLGGLSVAWNSTLPTASVFSLGTWHPVNTSGVTYVAYLFATLAGISKVGSYTGNGGSQTINCGFAAGARFILIKRTDAAGDWYVWDTVRGIAADNDPHLSLNTTAAEVTTDDSVDPHSSGFTVNQLAATNINVTSATYIFLAIS